MKILLAEDDLYLGELIVHMLKKKGVDHIDWVQEGEDAYDYALSSFYDVLILDWMLPNGDGVEICKRLRKNGYASFTHALSILRDTKASTNGGDRSRVVDHPAQSNSLENQTPLSNEGGEDL